MEPQHKAPNGSISKPNTRPGLDGEFEQPASETADSIARRPTVLRPDVVQLQRAIGNRATSRMLNGTTVQRRIFLNGPKGPVDIRTLAGIPSTGIEYALAHEADWFKTEIKPHLTSKRKPLTYFHGFLINDSGNYDISADVKADPATMGFADINQAIVRAFNIHAMQMRMTKGSKGIGQYKTLTRDGFPSAIKKAFDKTNIMSETKLGSKQLHLRHFVMGSWFRALPDIVEKATMNSHERADIQNHVAALIPRLGIYGGEKNATASGKLSEDCDALAYIMHNLEPNLNVGEGAENSLIGFLSHMFTELAIDVKKEQTAINRDDVPQLFQSALDAIGLVPIKTREEWVSDFGPIDVFETMIQHAMGDTDPAPPDEMANVLDQFAYQLGMDFMKRSNGLSVALQKEQGNVVAKLQGYLVSLGENMYATIQKGRADPRRVDATDIAKLITLIETLANDLEVGFPVKK